ncbi:hypothetical protein E2C01_076844 [Portunus trituberculatus]|uniref:Uncharacterized protein n=1 Tax=Portunus trituberculatus TaxID=210409 RepID=A0A5B7IK49_PORTR|nr:hypothetical protein [Portunus trituberculatus]
MKRGSTNVPQHSTGQLVELKLSCTHSPTTRIKPSCFLTGFVFTWHMYTPWSFLVSLVTVSTHAWASCAAEMRGFLVMTCVATVSTVRPPVPL